MPIDYTIPSNWSGLFDKAFVRERNVYWQGILREAAGDLEERRERERYLSETPQRCVELGLLICTCMGVPNAAPDGHRAVIRDPKCRVHKEFDRLG